MTQRGIEELSPAQVTGPGRRKLPADLKAALNLVRAFAAVYVVTYHVAQRHLHGIAGAPFRFGQEAVILFFLLSGYVIFVNEVDRAYRAPVPYLIRRVRRIYPPMLLSLALCAILYALDSGYNGTYTARSFVGTVLSVADISALKPGVITDPVFNNNPLWSLSYEMAFYLMFPVVLRYWHRRHTATNHVVGLVCVLSYVVYVLRPNHWALVVAYFSIWWVGAILGYATITERRTKVEAAKVSLLWLGVLCLVSVAAIKYRGSHGAGLYPVLPARHFLFALACACLCMTPLTVVLRRVAVMVAPAAAFVASISYGLYVFHYPLLLNWTFATKPAGFVVALVILVVLAYFGDRKLDEWLPRPKARRHRATAPR
ncbi:MAG TPA: acyltransferase [Acidothermaceae bacterium]|jgi:peptidoglycan/LPS O-acetylase OafA/YrhL